MVRRHKFCDFYTSSDLFQGFRFTEEEHEILKSLLVHDGDDDSYTLRVPGSYWLGGWKFTMVSEWGEAGARLYHKLRDGLEPELAAHRASAGRSIPESQELAVTIRRSDEERDTYAVGKIETCRGHQVISEHRMDWKQLAMEAACPRRTRIPPSLLFIKGHAKFEGQKLANIHSRSKTQPKKKGIHLFLALSTLTQQITCNTYYTVIQGGSCTLPQHLD